MSLPPSIATKVQAAVCTGEALVCLRLGAAVSRAHSRREDVHTGAADSSSAGTNPQRDPGAAEGLAVLTYELLDAHSDTALLADGLDDDRHWAAHLNYLRALQRKGRETLAHTAGSFDVR